MFIVHTLIIPDLFSVELEIVLVGVEAPGAEVEIAVLHPPRPVVVRYPLAQHLIMQYDPDIMWWINCPRTFMES